MSIPVTMRAIRRKAETIQADTPALSLIAETVEDMVKKNLPPTSSPGYGMTTGSNPMSGTTTPTNTFPSGPITTLFSIGIKERHDEDFNKVNQNPILTSLLQIAGNPGATVGSSPTPPHQTPPPISSPASNTKNHPMLMTLLKDNPTQDFTTLYGNSPLERQNSSSGSPRLDVGPGGSKPKKKRPRTSGDKSKHQTEDDFQRELFSMDVDSQNPIFDVNMTGDTLDTPHITPAPSQCSTPPTAYQQPLTHPQHRIVRLPSSDSIGADVNDILSDIAEEASKIPGANDDCQPIGTPIRDSSSSGHSHQSTLFDSDVFQTNNSESMYTDPADLLADANVSPTSDSSNQFFPEDVEFNPDLLNSQSGFGDDPYDESSQSGDNDDFKDLSAEALSALGVPMLGTDGGDSKFKGSSHGDIVDFSIIAPGCKDVLDIGSQSPLMSGELAKDKPPKPRQKDGNGTNNIGLQTLGLDGKPGKRSRTPSNDSKSKDKLTKRKKADSEVKSPSHSSSTRPFTPPSSTGGSKSPVTAGRSQTPPGIATPPIPKITIQIPKGTVTVGKPSSHSQYSNTGPVSSSSNKGHHSHSSSSSSSNSSKTKSNKSESSSSSKMGSSLYSGQSGSTTGPSKSSSQSAGKSGSSPVTKHGLSNSGGTKLKPQGKPSSVLMNPSLSKPNISPSHARPSGGSDKMSSPMKPVPGTPPSSKAKSPINSGSGGSHTSGTGSSSNVKSSSGIGSAGSSQKQPPSNSSSSSSASFSSSASNISSSSQNQHGGSKGKSPSRNKKPSLTAVIDKLKHGVGTSGPGSDDPMESQGGGSSSSSSHPVSSKHSSSGSEFQGKRDKSEKDKSKVSVSGGSVDSSKKMSDSKNVSSTGVAKIIISKHDGGSPSIKAKVTLQKPGEGGGDGLRPQMSSKSYGSPLISGSTPKHERCSPSHSKSPAYTPQNVDSESESGSSIAEKSYQNSPSSDDGARPPPEYSSEKHKKHKKEKKKLKDKDRDRDKERDKKKSHSLKPEGWSKSPISSEQTMSMSSNVMLSNERSSRPSPGFLIGEDDDLMDVALIGD